MLLRRLRVLGVDEAAGLPPPQRGVMAVRARSSSACVPCSTMRPWSSTTSRSMRAMVESRCAMAITVLPAISVLEALLDRGLDFAVERRGRLVEHQDRCVLEDDARDRDALALAAGELHAALADLRVVAAPALPVLQVADELVAHARAAPPRSISASRRVGPAIADVVADRAVQQRGVLRHHARSARAGFLRDLRDVLAVDQDAAVLEVEEAQQQVDQRRLAGAGAADQADLLARLDRQREPSSTECDPSRRVSRP